MRIWKKGGYPAHAPIDPGPTRPSLLKDEIRSMEYDTTSYPPPESFFENVETVIPKSLKVFLDDVITADKSGAEGYFSSKIVAIAHTT